MFSFLACFPSHFAGPIPPKLGDLAALQSLDLRCNELSGPIPPELGELAALTVLSLRDNQLTGSIPPELGKLVALEALCLWNNQLTGHIPAQLGQLGALHYLYLDNNELHGPIPKELGALSKLERLFLASNKLIGHIPPQLGQLGALKLLRLDGNELDGPIPPELGKLAALTRLELQRNILSGPIPPELGKLAALKELYLSENKLSGPIPEELGKLTALQQLFLSDNNLSGPIPSELGHLSALKELNLRRNQLSGTIPKEIGKLTALQRLHLHSNQLSGRIPEELGKLTALQRLYLRNNKLSGEQHAIRTGTAKNAPPQLQQILPLLLTFLDSRSWCACLVVNSAARDAVRALFSGLVPDGRRPDEGWTVPLDVLTLKIDEAGQPHLAANECGIAIHGAPGDLAHLSAMIVPAPQTGFLLVAGQLHIATSPILRCRWTGNDRPQGRWTVSFPLEEEHGLSNPTKLSQVLRRGDELGDEWEVHVAGLKASRRRPAMQVEVTHFSDVVTADELRKIEKTHTKSYYERKRVWRPHFFSRNARVFNASSAGVTVLQVAPPRMDAARGGQLTFPGGGVGGNREYTSPTHATSSDRAMLPAWDGAMNDSHHQPPTAVAKFRTLPGATEMGLIPYTAVSDDTENDNLTVHPREHVRCLAGYNYYLLQKMLDVRQPYRKKEVNVHERNEVETVMNEVLPSLGRLSVESREATTALA
ncbi:unnamed protein product [Ectocarpus sp. 4 AP-2014]